MVLAALPAAAQTTAPSDGEELLIRRPAHDGEALAAPAPPPERSSMGDLGQIVLALGAVIALVLLLRWAGRRVLGMPPPGRTATVLRVVGRVPLGPRQHLLLVQLGQRLVLVGDGGGQLSALAQVSDADEVATLLGQLRAPQEGGFASIFRRHEKPADEENDDSGPPAAGGNDDSELSQTRRELDGLSEKVQTLVRQFRQG
jgi:flagellar biogenesis protein FliO